MLFDHFGEIGWGGNGGFHCVNLAVQFGAARVVGIGFDMTLQGGVHWHGRHPPGLTNPTQASVDKWRERLGIPFIIGSPGSALTAFPKLPLLEAIYGTPPPNN